MSLYDAARFQEMENKSVLELIEVIRDLDHENDTLHGESNDLRAANDELAEQVEDLKEQLARNHSVVTQPDRSISVQQVEEAEADAFADA